MGVNNNDPQIRAAQLWELINASNKLLGMVLNVPPDNGRHEQKGNQEVTIDGVVQPRAYLSKLIYIVGEIPHLDETNVAGDSATALYTPASELISELNELVSQTRESWWTINMERVEPDHIVQFIHHYVTMRLHLPFAMRQDSIEKGLHSRVACMNACIFVVQRYQFLCRMLPPGFFLSRILDLQAFTAAVILLLTRKSWSSINLATSLIEKAKIENEVDQVIRLLRQRSRGLPGSHITHNAVNTILSLRKFLEEDEGVAQVHQITLNVPLLGRGHVRRNTCTSLATISTGSRPFELPSGSGSWNPSERFSPNTFHTATPMEDAVSAQGNWHQGDHLWFIENCLEDLLQEPFMGDGFDLF